MSLSDKRMAEDFPCGAEEWMLHCPLSPSLKRQKVGGYISGGSWHDGRVEIKFDCNFVDDQNKRMVQEVTLQAFERLNQTIIGEGLFRRSYTQRAKGQNLQTTRAIRAPPEYLGDDGDASCGRIGSIIPISQGYAVYGRVDNIQVLVQDPGMFAQMMDGLIDNKVAMLRQATSSLGSLGLHRFVSCIELDDQYKNQLIEFAEGHQDKLVALICENPVSIVERLVEWEQERQNKVSTFGDEHRQNTMDLEHECHQRRLEILRTCQV